MGTAQLAVSLWDNQAPKFAKPKSANVRLRVQATPVVMAAAGLVGAAGVISTVGGGVFVASMFCAGPTPEIWDNGL